MKSTSLAGVRRIALSEIDGEDQCFSISLPWFSLDSLVQSVGQHGILCPLQIQARADGRFRIVMGFRRFRAAQAAGLMQVPCLLRDGQSQLTLFRLVLEERLSSGCFHFLEKAHVLLKLKEFYRVSEQDLLEEVLPSLGIRADRFHLQRYLSIARLGEVLQRRLAEGLEPDLALGLARWSPVDQERFLSLLSSLQPGRSRQKQLFTILDELRAGGRWGQDTPDPVSLCWRASGAEAIELDEQSAPQDRLKAILGVLRRLRFPKLVAQEQRYGELKALLKLPPQIRFQAPEYFEGDRIQISFSFAKPEELQQLGKTLVEVSAAPELGKIVDLL